MNRRKIVSVEANDENPNEINVKLDNGVLLMLELAPKLHEPLFAEIQMLHLPRTDGSRVYWSKAASLSLDGLMNMLTDETGSENELECRR